MVPMWPMTRPPRITGQCQSPWSLGTHPITQAETAGTGGALSPGPPTTQMRSFPTLVTRTAYPHALLRGIRNPPVHTQSSFPHPRAVCFLGYSKGSGTGRPALLRLVSKGCTTGRAGPEPGPNIKVGLRGQLGSALLLALGEP